MSTDLRLINLGLPSYAARGLKEAIDPIDGAGQLRRTVNGVLRNVGNSAFRKYKITVTGEDTAGLPLDGLNIGMAVTVHAITEFSVEGTLPSTPGDWDANTRPIVPGTLREDGGFIFYRPILDCLVSSFNQETDDWGAVVSFSLELSEV